MYLIYIFQIFYFVSNILLRILSHVQLAILMNSINWLQHVAYSNIVMVLLTLAKEGIILIVLIAKCEKIYCVIGDVQTACQLALGNAACPEKRRFCKNVRRSSSAAFSKIYICNILAVDAKLAVSLMSVTTTYTIVMLQAILIK
uniref:Uncharacterized protein n=1 Tax=Bombyx mori TaxID=7091 RepID=A0A8R2R134_BOMMO|nr:uncharacterized protein LOC105841791 isoform X2 [Bombyx mori]